MEEEKDPLHASVPWHVGCGLEGRKITPYNEVYHGSAYGQFWNLVGNETCTDEW